MTPGALATLVSLRWERIQVIVRLRPASPDALVPATIRLERADDPATAMPATRAWSEAGDVVVRFNVMQGPGNVPLEPGDWALTAASADGVRRPVHVETAAASPLDAGVYATDRGEFAVRPAIVDGQLRMAVTLDPSRMLPGEFLRTGRPLYARALLAILGWGFRLLYRLARLSGPRDPRWILFAGHYGTDLSGDMRAVLTAMAERKLDREFRISTAPPYHVRSPLDWLRLVWQIARAGTLVIEEDVLHVLPYVDARVIQMWHASGALKTIGYSRVGKRAARSPWSRHYKYFTYAIVSGEHDVPLFAEAFGMPEERVLPLGHPRMDRFFDEEWRERAREATLAAFPTVRGRRLILFAPTWRPSPSGRSYDLSILDYRRLYELCLETDAVFMIRLHPTVKHPIDIPPEYADRILNGTTSVMDAPGLLCATDLLITDYSSIILEYALLGRPMLFFAPDLDAYRADRDVYMPYEDFVPGRIVQTFDELVEAIRGEDYQIEKVAPFAASQFTYRDGHATDRVIALILGRREGVRYHSAPATAPGEIGAPKPEQDTDSE